MLQSSLIPSKSEIHGIISQNWLLRAMTIQGKVYWLDGSNDYLILFIITDRDQPSCGRLIRIIQSSDQHEIRMVIYADSSGLNACSRSMIKESTIPHIQMQPKSIQPKRLLLRHPIHQNQKFRLTRRWTRQFQQPGYSIFWKSKP